MVQRISHLCKTHREVILHIYVALVKHISLKVQPLQLSDKGIVIFLYLFDITLISFLNGPIN